MASQTIFLNDHLVGQVPRIDHLTDLLITERKSVLFVGEGDFSFTVAFAALREVERHGSTRHHNPGTWDGIIATRYEATTYKPPPNFREVTVWCIGEVQRYNLPWLDHSTATSGNIKALRRLDTASNLLWLCDVDARGIPPELTAPSSVIWFQCPWLQGSTYPLLHDFLMNTSESIAAGVHVCVGITTHPQYVESYKLANILGYSGSSYLPDVLRAYRFCGVDDTLIQRLLSCGYHHQGLKDIHNYIRQNHVTLVFCKL